MVQYRTFRNTDPPALLRLWNQTCSGRGAVPLRTPTFLECLLFCKPYFDPAGVVVAEDGRDLVGFALSGFGPDGAGRGLDRSTGVLCLIVVRPDHRRRGVGSHLLAQSEAYLQGQGARVLLAGSMAPYNPFGFGLYGGSQSAGFLESDPTLRPFLEKRGYKVATTALIFQRHLDRPFNVIDGRFPILRRRYEVRSLPRRGSDGWYQESVRGPLLEPQEFRLEDRSTGEAAGHATVWEMDPFSDRWNEHAVGIVAVDVAEDHRRQGLARLLLGQVLRFYHDQYFTLAEAQVSPDNAPALGLVRGLGFHQVDAGHLYRKR